MRSSRAAGLSSSPRGRFARPAASAMAGVDPHLVFLIGSTLERVHLGQPLGRATGLCLGLRSLAAVQASQQPAGWSNHACRYGAQPRLLWNRPSDEAWRLCSAPLLSESLQGFVSESLLLWTHAGLREQQVGTRHFLTVDLPVLLLASQALQVVFSVALVHTGNGDVTRTFRSWYNTWGVGCTGATLAFCALECSTQLDAPGAPEVCCGLLPLPHAMRPFSCWEPLALSCIMSPAALVSQGCAHVSGIWAGLLWGKLAYAGGGLFAPRLRNGILVRPGHPRADDGTRPERRHRPNDGHRLGGDIAWWARSPLLIHAGITAAVLVLTHVTASRPRNATRDGSRTKGEGMSQMSEWFGGTSSGTGFWGTWGGELWDSVVIDTTSDTAEVRAHLADAVETARQSISALWA